MKKHIYTTSVFVCLATLSLAQSNAKWSRNGDALSNGDWLGSTNNIPLLLKANNALGLKINTNGDVVIKALDLNNTTTNGLVLTNGQGKLFRYDFNGDPSQYLAGDGTWQTAASQQWKENGNDLYKPTGNVGIGAVPSPFYKLDVQGDARISNNLYVGGGIIITDKVNAATEIKGQNIKVDNDLEVQNSALFNGTSTFKAATNFNGVNTFGNKADFNQLATFNNQATFNNTLRALQGIVLENTMIPAGIRYTANTAGGTFSYGRQIVPIPVSCAASSTAVGANHQFDGNMQIFNTNGSGNYLAGSGLLNMQTFTNGNSSIDASTGGAIGGALLINYFCGSNTGINTGTLGGTVSMGKNVELGFPNPNTDCALNMRAAQNYSGIDLETNYTADWSGIAHRIRINQNFATAFVVNNRKTGTELSTFSIMGNGTTTIGTAPAGSPFSYAMLNIYAPSNGQYIAAYDNATNTLNFRVGTGGDLLTREISIEDKTIGNVNFKVQNNGNVKAQEIDASKYLLNGQPLGLLTLNNGATTNEFLSASTTSDLRIGNSTLSPSESLRSFVLENSANTPIVGAYDANNLISFEGENPTIIFKDNTLFGSNSDKSDLLIGAANGFARFVTNDGFAFFMNADNKNSAGTFSILTKQSSFDNANLHKVVLDLQETGALTLNTESDAVRALAVNNSTGQRTFSVLGNGYVYAREINVYASGTQIPDYVFDKTYKLRTLAEVESYISTNKHLPNIPSAKEIQDKGTLSLTEMNLKLLEKVEELTLYMIEQNKTLNAQIQKSEAQGKELQELKKRLN